jgi:hypothetical protein
VPATYDDANLVVQLLNWSTQIGLMDAITTITEDDFDPTSARADDPAVRSVLIFGEIVGTFVKQGVLDAALVFDMWWLEGMWARVGPAATVERQRLEEPRLYENFEALAARAAKGS